MPAPMCNTTKYTYHASMALSSSLSAEQVFPRSIYIAAMLAASANRKAQKDKLREKKLLDLLEWGAN